MARWAIMKDDRVANVVIAEEDAAEVLALLLPDADTFVIETVTTGPAYPGGDLVAGRFRMAQPFPSWEWNADAWEWVAPTPYPEGGNGYLWDEDTLTWIEIPGIEPEE